MSDEKVTIGVEFRADVAQARKALEVMRELGFEAARIRDAGDPSAGAGSHATAVSGAPPPPPSRDNVGAGRGSASPKGTSMGAPPPPPNDEDDPGDWDPRPPVPGPGGWEIGEPYEPLVDGRTTRPPAPPAARGGRGAFGGFVGGVASTAVGLGLGQGAIGFLLSSGEKFLQLDTTLTQLEQRFGSVTEAVVETGRAMGYTIERSSALAEVMGQATNRPDEARFRRQAAVARLRGIDPATLMSTVGAIEQLRPTGRGLSRADFARMLGQADRGNMGDGRLPEYLQSVSQLAQMQLGRVSSNDGGFQGAVGALELARQVFDPNRNEFGRGGRSSVQFVNQTDAMLRSGGAMETLLVRAMGFGRQGSDLDYIQMRKRLEAGVFDPRNLSMVMDYLGGTRGLNRTGMFRALEPFARQAGMSAENLDALVSAFDTPQERAGFRALDDTSRRAGLEAFVEGLSRDELRAFRKEGFAGLMRERSTIARGEQRAIQIEAMQVAIGEPLSAAMVDLTGVMSNLAGSIGDLVGQDVGTLLKEATSALREATGMIRTFTTSRQGPIGDSLATQQRVYDELGLDGWMRLQQQGLLQLYGPGVSPDAPPLIRQSVEQMIGGVGG